MWKERFQSFIITHTSLLSNSSHEIIQRAAASSSAAAGHGSPIFTFSELGMDDPTDFHNFMDPPASG
ncbi:hypothetical protein A2U01_0064089 [Trifolium medium]|uniref:Uncharacterized protein n=1 Tax=Trifolium medium TaxID=97028 RepID=A0A392S340_9FABA|nr:hypothetical protein [Trifolium medium]